MPMTIFSTCSLLMAVLFAYSASVQLNDHDWYLWFPLYCSASVVNLIHGTTCESSTKVAKFAFWLGLFLFINVAMEDFSSEIAGIWSLDISERVVREKIGSGLVIVSMFLLLKASSNLKMQISDSVQYGTAILVGISYGLPIVFFVIQKEEMKF